MIGRIVGIDTQAKNLTVVIEYPSELEDDVIELFKKYINGFYDIADLDEMFDAVEAASKEKEDSKCQ
jgi:hypothetical protein